MVSVLVCLSVLSVCQSVSRWVGHLFCRFVDWSFGRFVGLSAVRSVGPTCLSVCLSVCLFVCLSRAPSFVHLSFICCYTTSADRRCDCHRYMITTPVCPCSLGGLESPRVWKYRISPQWSTSLRLFWSWLDCRYRIRWMGDPLHLCSLARRHPPPGGLRT